MSERDSGSERERESKIRWVRFCSCDFARREDGGKRWRPSTAPLGRAGRPCRGVTHSNNKGGLRSFYDDAGLLSRVNEIPKNQPSYPQTTASTMRWE